MTYYILVSQTADSGDWPQIDPKRIFASFTHWGLLLGRDQSAKNAFVARLNALQFY